MVVTTLVAQRNKIIEQYMGWLMWNITKKDEKVEGWNRLENLKKK